MNGCILKEKIANDFEKICVILEKIECHSITLKGNEIRFALPNHNNPTSGVMTLDTLKVNVWNDLDIHGDIITLVQKIKEISYGETILFICFLLNLNVNYQEDKTKNSTNWLSSLRESTKIKRSISFEKPTLFDLNSFNFIFYPRIELVREGITPYVQKMFSIGYDYWSQRILFPHRMWNGNGKEFAGIIGRTTNENWELLGLSKYFPLKQYKKSCNLYGYWENTHIIVPDKFNNKYEKKLFRSFKTTHQLIVYEAEKSVLKRASLKDFTGVALCGHALSEEQARIIRQMDDVVEVVFALDADMPEQLSQEMCRRIFNKKTSYIFDKDHKILGPKDSPADCSEADFLKLLAHRIEY